MTNFNDYIKTNIDDKTANFTRPSNEHLEDLINKYQNLSSSDLMSEFMKLTYEKKKKGELNKGELDSIKKSIRPYLNEEQNAHLEKIMNMVDNV